MECKLHITILIKQKIMKDGKIKKGDNVVVTIGKMTGLRGRVVSENDNSVNIGFSYVEDHEYLTVINISKKHVSRIISYKQFIYLSVAIFMAMVAFLYCTAFTSLNLEIKIACGIATTILYAILNLIPYYIMKRTNPELKLSTYIRTYFKDITTSN